MQADGQDKRTEAYQATHHTMLSLGYVTGLSSYMLTAAPLA